MVPDLVEIILGFCVETSWGALGERQILNLVFQWVLFSMDYCDMVGWFYILKIDMGASIVMIPSKENLPQLNQLTQWISLVDSLHSTVSPALPW